MTSGSVPDSGDDARPVTTTRRATLIGALAAALAVPVAASASAGTGYGSGALGAWTGYGRAISGTAQIGPAVRNGLWQFGDSIAVQDGRELAERLYRRTGKRLAVHNWSGRPTAPAVAALEAWASAYGLPRGIIMATGSNDVFAPPAMAAQIDRVMAVVGPSTVVLWVNTYVRRWKQPVSRQLYDLQNAGWVNAQIAEAAGRHPNLHVVRWFEYLASPNSSGSLARPKQLLSDGVHTTVPVGQQTRNELIVRAVEQLVA